VKRLAIIDCETLPEGAIEARCDRCVKARPCSADSGMWAICIWAGGTRVVTPDWGCKDFKPKEGS
jgi:hypothetical protein